MKREPKKYYFFYSSKGLSTIIGVNRLIAILYRSHRDVRKYYFAVPKVFFAILDQSEISGTLLAEGMSQESSNKLFG